MADAKESAALSPQAAARFGPLPRLLPLALAFYGALLGAAVAWRSLVDGVGPWTAGALSPPWPLGARIGAGVALGAALIGTSRVWTSRSEAGRRLAAELGRLVGGLSTPRVCLLAAASGLAEEAFFRGALQPRVGWLAASLLFGLAHFHPSRELRLWSLTAALAGLALGALFQASGDLLAPALTHALLNAVNLRWLARRANEDLRAP
ncbi:MAG: type II CAAX prenyl endopeptidase Rce1 family protein [Myxococcota bacterium]|jgi:membrane protease YdiL (CAAX protease family)